MGKTIDVLKKIRDTKGTFHSKMGSIKDRNGMDITEVEDIKKRWQEYTEKLYKKIFRTQTTMMVWSLTYTQTSWNAKSRWALGSITTNEDNGGDGIPAELFQILKDNAVKVLDSKWQRIWKTQQWAQDWKRSVFIPIPTKGNAKECSNYHIIASYTLWLWDDT